MEFFILRISLAFADSSYIGIIDFIEMNSIELYTTNRRLVHQNWFFSHMKPGQGVQNLYQSCRQIGKFTLILLVCISLLYLPLITHKERDYTCLTLFCLETTWPRARGSVALPQFKLTIRQTYNKSRQ